MKKLFLCSKEIEEAYIDSNCIDVKDILLATTNYQYYMQKIKSGKEIIFLEPEGNIPYEDIWEIIDKINNVISDCRLDNSLIYMLSYHFEHYMPKTLSTLILNLRLLDKVVSEYSVGHFYIIDNKDSWKINEAIFLYALSKDIECTIIDDVTGRVKDCLFTLQESVYGKSCIKNNKYEELELREEKQIDSWVQQERKQINENGQQQYYMGVLYCAKDCVRMVKWTKQLLKILDENAVVISFYQSQDNEIFKNCGYTVHCIEDYFDQSSFLNQFSTFKEDRDMILRAAEENLSVKYKDINLSHYLYLKLTNYFFREVPEYIYMYNCTYRYFAVHHFETIRAWGISNFWQTRVCYFNTRNYGTQFFCISRTIVLAWKNHEPWEDIISIRVYPNGYPSEQMISNKYKGEVYYTFDVLEGINYYEKMLPSRGRYSIKNIKIAFLPSYPFEGVSTFRNYENKCNVIIEKISQCKCTINFKNHPVTYQYLDDEIRERYGDISNLHFVDKSESGDIVIQDSDLVITDGSTVVFDAASYQKPVFIIAAGSDYELIEQHKEGFIICTTPEELCAKIISIIEDKNNYEKRVGEIIEKQNRYLKSLYGEYDSDAGREICKMIRDKVLALHY